jgi:hypothetical protein
MMEKEVAYTLSPTSQFKTTQAEGKGKHSDKEPYRCTHQQAHTPAGTHAPRLGAEKDSPGSVYLNVEYI